MTFKELTSDVKKGEVQLIDYWKNMDLLKRSVDERSEGENYVFYDGPPTANGRPGIHHVISRTLKDMTCRYKTMEGYKVRRKAGWDTHGLPVEIEVEKELGLHNKGEIEDYGVEAFNRKCRDSVFRYRDLWTEMSDRMAFLADMDNPYVTLENDYIESVWHLLDDFNKKGLVYKGAKILPYCPRCGTGLASHEVALGYKEDEVTTVYVKFPVKGKENVYFLAWTTTPWTLPSNVALTVHPDVIYVRAKQGENIYYLAKDLVDQVLKDDFGPVEILQEIKGRDMEYMEYDQLLPFIDISGKAFFVTLADYVTTSDGTGIVHSAPAFGEEDAATGKVYDLAYVNPVDERGQFSKGPYKGKFVMDCDPEIIDYLREHGKLYAKQKISHNYPHCWRCDTPLIYYSKPSWYIEVTKLRDKMVEENKKVNWFPDYVGEKRFGNWLENLNDWALSRSRYWGTPLNIWVCDDCGAQKSIGSRQELVKEAREEIDENIELHRPYVDRVTLACPECGGVMHRESDVIDVWFDSGAMPFAQLHYPFENTEDFEKEFYPADFICEGIDQTRGWFYSLMAISVLYKGRAPYKNVLVNDLVLDKEGQKMSKSKGNTLDPFKLFDGYGADTVRFYSLYVSAPWLPTRFDINGLNEVRSKFFRTIKNVYAMFALYANTNEWNPAEFEIDSEKRPVIDRWILSRLNSLLASYKRDMDKFEYNRVVHNIADFVSEDLSNWYIRRNRQRFWSSEPSLENKAVFRTTWEVLLSLSKMIAPITPFLADQLYLSLTDKKAMDSVHLEYLDHVNQDLIDSELEEKMDIVRRVVALGRASREDAGIKVRQPLKEILLDARFRDKLDEFVDLVKEELNIKDVIFSDEMDSYMNIILKPNFRLAGKELGKNMKAFASALAKLDPRETLEKVQTDELVMALNGEEIKIPEDFILVEYHAKEGFDVSSDRGLSVILDTVIDEELENEGYAREFTSKLQQQRKKNGYEITDRIHIYYYADETIKKAFSHFEKDISSETLALSINLLTETDAAKMEGDKMDINGHEVFLKLEKAENRN